MSKLYWIYNNCFDLYVRVNRNFLPSLKVSFCKWNIPIIFYSVFNDLYVFYNVYNHLKNETLWKAICSFMNTCIMLQFELLNLK